MKRAGTGRILWDFAAGNRRHFLLAVATSALGILFGFLSPQVIRFAVDSVIGTDAMDLPDFALAWINSMGGREYLLANLALCGAAIVVCAALNGLFGYFWRTGIARGSEGFIKTLRDRLFSHIQHLPFEWHGRNQTGDIIQRCTSDVETLRAFMAQQLPEAVRTAILLAVALWLMYSMDVTMALICTAFIPIIVLYSALFGARIAAQFRAADEAEGELMVAVQENLTGVRVVRAFGRERYELGRFNNRVDRFTDMWVELGKTMGWFWGIGDLASCVQLLVVICLGAYFAAEGRMSLGTLLAFISYTQTITWPVRNLGRVLSEFSKATVSLDRIRDILDAPVEPPEPGALTPDMHGDIVFENVSFNYGGTQILRELSFEIKSGSTFGILGSTGSGKSTLTYLLNRLYELPEDGGRITVGGTDIRDIDRGYLRRSVGLVLQEPFLFTKTVEENISIASASADIADVRRSAGVAAVDEDIRSFREGYETVVGERGVTLSGGQKQRIAIARTLTMGCPVMVFDDSMSAVDMETDAKIRESLRENTAGATVILISHRINTLMQADRILVLEGGRISDSGTHAELISRDGIYRRVYEMQSGLLPETKGGDGNA